MGILSALPASNACAGQPTVESLLQLLEDISSIPGGARQIFHSSLTTQDRLRRQDIVGRKPVKFPFLSDGREDESF